MPTTLTKQEVEETVQLDPTGQVQGGGKGKEVVTTATLTREYISAGNRNPMLAALTEYVQALPPYIDDLTRDFGADLYLRMMHDPQVASTVDVLRMSATDDGLQLSVPEDVPEEEHEEGQQIVDLCQHCLDNLDTPFSQVLYELTEGIVTGHKVAEQIYDYRMVDGVLRMLLSDLKCKPNGATAFVVTDKNAVLGLLPTLQQGYTSAQTLSVGDGGEIKGLLPRAKFAVFTFNPRNGDPRGTSVLRAVYTQWWMKMQTQPEYLAYLATYAQPSVHGTLPEGASDVKELDALGVPTGVILKPADEMRAGLEAIRNGGVIVTPHGSAVVFLQVAGEGKVFIEAINLFDKQIAKGVTKQTLATEEAEHMARAASTTHQDVLAMPVDQISATLVRMVRSDILRPLVLYNFGADKMHLVPAVSIASVEQQDRPAMMTAIGGLHQSGYMTAEQYPATDAELGLPVREVIIEPVMELPGEGA